MTDSAQTEAPKEVTIEDASKQEMEKVLKIIRKSDYKISMLSLLLCS